MSSGTSGRKVAAKASNRKGNFAAQSKTLFSSSVVIVDLVTRLLDPIEIFNLWNTGCRLLQRTMAHGGVTIFEMNSKVEIDRKWPSLISQFRQLRSLTLKTPFGKGFSNIDLKSLSPSIVNVHFEFREAELCFYVEPPLNTFLSGQPEPEMIDIKLIFPNLQSIYLAGAFHVSNEFVSNFPKKSTHFISVQTIDDVRPPKTPSFFSNEGIESLPPNLSSLSIQGYCPWAKNDLLKLPFYLTSLHLLGTCPLENDCFEALPPCLEVFELTGCNHLKIAENSFSSLPKTLLTLKIKNVKEISSSCFPLLPRDIEHLEIGAPILNVTTEHVKGLPKKIKTLSISGCHFSEFDTFAAFPLNLKTLILSFKQANPHINFNQDVYRQNISNFLPKSITHLELLNTSPGVVLFQNLFLSGLPNNMTHIRIPRNAFSGDKLIDFLKIFPLTFLDTGEALVAPQHVKDLPRTLTYINMRHWTGMDKKAIAGLPRKISEVILLYGELMCDKAIKNLPPNLTHLELRNSPKLTNECIANLPRRLNTVSISGLVALDPKTLDRSLLPPNISHIELLERNRIEPMDTQRIAVAELNQIDAPVADDRSWACNVI